MTTLERQNTVWSYSYQVLGLLAIGFLLILPAFWGGISELIGRWDKQEEYSHGYLIPIVSGYFIWQRKDFLKSLEFKPTWFPVIFVAMGVAISAIGEISALYVLIHFSVILIILALAWSLMGWDAFKYVLIPLALLAFAIPLPYFIEAALTADLQLISSKLGVAFIRFFGIPVFAEGNVIDLGIYQLQVVEACSGLRYLYPLMGVGFIVVYLYQVEFWKRALVFLSTIPVTIFMNSFRIGVIGILVDIWGIEMADGFLHYFEGWIIFIACLGILVLEMWALNKIGRRTVSFAASFGMPVNPELPSENLEHRTRGVPKPFIACVALIILSFAVTKSIDTRIEAIPDREQFVNFPLYFDGWTGKQDNLPQIIAEGLGLTDYLINNYSRGSEPHINFYVAYYESQRKGLSPHSPRVCVPGGGWSITEIERMEIDVENREIPLNINRAVVQNGRHRQLVYYWFKQRGRDIANEYWMKWYLLTDSLSMNRTDGSLVRLVTSILPDEKDADADKRLQAFLADIEGKLDIYVPN
jgi:exosortase D (VPLPA-CTERM-specific)